MLLSPERRCVLQWLLLGRMWCVFFSFFFLTSLRQFNHWEFNGTINRQFKFFFIRNSRRMWNFFGNAQIQSASQLQKLPESYVPENYWRNPVRRWGYSKASTFFILHEKETRIIFISYSLLFAYHNTFSSLNIWKM